MPRSPNPHEYEILLVTFLSPRIIIYEIMFKVECLSDYTAGQWCYLQQLPRKSIASTATQRISILSAWQPPGLGEAIMTTGLDLGQGWGLLTCLDIPAQYRLSQFRLACPGLLAQFPRSPPNIHEYLILLVTYLSPRIIIIYVIIFRIEWHSDMLVVNDVTSNNFRGSQLQVQPHKGFLIWAPGNPLA